MVLSAFHSVRHHDYPDAEYDSAAADMAEPDPDRMVGCETANQDDSLSSRFGLCIEQSLLSSAVKNIDERPPCARGSVSVLFFLSI